MIKFQKSTYRRLPVLALVAVMCTGVYAQEKPARIDIDRALEIALRSNHDYRLAVKRQRAAKEKVNAAWGMLYPALGSGASMVRQDAENGFMSLSDGQYDIQIVQLAFGINPGGFYNSLQLSRKNYTAVTQDLRRVRNEITHSVIKSYFSVLLAEEMISLRRDTLKLLRENLKDVQNLYKTGSVPRFELLQAEVRVKSQESLLLEAENDFRVALSFFNYHLGSDSGLYSVDRGILDNRKYREPGQDIQEACSRLTQKALANRPEVVQVRLKKEIAAHRKGLQRSLYLWPTFSVGGYYGMTKYMPNSVNVGVPGVDFSGITGTDEWQKTWQVRVAATYRWGALLPVDRARAGVREEKIRMQEAEEELERLRKLIMIRIRSSYSGLVTASHTIRTRMDNVETAEEGLRIARESYRAGVIKNSELLGAHVALTEAKTGYIHSVNSYYLSLAGLKKEIGTDDDSIIFGGK